jgi:hypothetical protein
MGLLAPRRKAPMFVNLIFAGLFISSPVLNLCLFEHYQHTCPHEMDEQDGFIYTQNDHGSIVYLNLAEYRTMQASWAYLCGSILATFGLRIWLSREPRARKPISSDDRS